MASDRNKPHLLVPRRPKTEDYTPHGRDVPRQDFDRPGNRKSHSKFLTKSLSTAAEESTARQEENRKLIKRLESKPGTYIEFRGQPGVELNTQSLENKTNGIEVVAASTFLSPTDGPVHQATVFVPEGKLKYFFKRFQDYAGPTKEGRKAPPHSEMIDRIAELSRATLRALWTDEPEEFPKDTEQIWWEVWLRRTDGSELDRFNRFAEEIEAEVGPRQLQFPDRTILIVKSSARRLARTLDVLGDIAEVRRAKETAAFFVNRGNSELGEWSRDLADRVELPPSDAPAVCVLDTGVTRGHPLLKDLIAPDCATAVDPNWGGHDDGGSSDSGHGTLMAGLAAYGDLVPILNSKGTVRVRNTVESVKILPPKGANRPDLYGAITAQAASVIEIANPDVRRCFSMAVASTDSRDRGQPTSWSSAIDALAAGRAFDTTDSGMVYLSESEESARRLFVLSAGNVPPELLEKDHLNRSDIETVHDPAQAWNALTVGACTRKTLISDDEYRGMSPIAESGDLSPWSTTSVSFADPWPIKPDVVFEGGNVAYDEDMADGTVPDLCLLSTNSKPTQQLFDIVYATSAATAQVARISASIAAEYPTFWPETVRALVVHSASWTSAMRKHLNAAAGKAERARLVRRYGFGVPNLSRATRSANDALTLIVQSTIHPFVDGKMREMHLHNLPWPKSVLKDLDASSARLRVTLSYFIEPNPGRRGWKQRHRYASHGLRFAVKQPTDSIDEFRKRLNRQALEEEEPKPDAAAEPLNWYLGPTSRNRGSIHSDFWEGTSADLAELGAIGIFPVSGWWKDLPKRDRSEMGARYSLVVSIETDAEEVDLWTAVATQIGVAVDAD